MKLTDVIIKEEFRRDHSTGLDSEFSCLTIWADAGALETILGIKGVSLATTAHEKGCYWAWLDPRYDRAAVIAEIEAAIKINVPPQD